MSQVESADQISLVQAQQLVEWLRRPGCKHGNMSPKRQNQPSPAKRSKQPAALRVNAPAVEPEGMIYVEWEMEGASKKSDFLALYKDESCEPGEYEASLLLKAPPGSEKGRRVFIAPMVEGKFVIRLIRNEDIVLAETRVHIQHKSQEVAPPRRAPQPQKQIKRIVSADSVLQMPFVPLTNVETPSLPQKSSGHNRSH